MPAGGTRRKSKNEKDQGDATAGSAEGTLRSRGRVRERRRERGSAKVKVMFVDANFLFKLAEARSHVMKRFFSPLRNESRSSVFFLSVSLLQ